MHLAFRVDTTAPAAPTGVIATASSSSAIQVAWGTVTDAHSGLGHYTSTTRPRARASRSPPARPPTWSPAWPLDGLHLLRDRDRTPRQHLGQQRRAEHDHALSGRHPPAPVMTSLTSSTHPVSSTGTALASATFAWNASDASGVKRLLLRARRQPRHRAGHDTGHGLGSATLTSIPPGCGTARARPRHARQLGDAMHLAFRVDTTAPAAPTASSQRPPSSSAIQVAWGTVTDAHSGLGHYTVPTEPRHELHVASGTTPTLSPAWPPRRPTPST